MLKLSIQLSRAAPLAIRRNIFSQDEEILFETLNKAGVVTLNRPKPLNALNIPMTSKMLQKLKEWEIKKSLVIIKGAGEKAFCAGGDLKTEIDKVEGPKFYYIAANVVNLIEKYKIPFVAILNGIAMGGGLNLTVPGRYRIATDETVIAIPGAKIGLYGASYFQTRLQNNLGLYLGLTGHRLKGKDVVKSGIATHFVPSKRLYELEELLSRCNSDMEVNSLLSKFHEPSDEFSLADNIKHINYCFAASTIEEIIQRLEEVQNDWSQNTLKILKEMCPGSIKLTLRALQIGAKLDLSEWLKMEFRIACHAIESKDFSEGVRALLIDKDNNPKWQHASLAEVNDDYVESFFTKLPQDKELQFFDAKL